jgi:integrase
MPLRVIYRRAVSRGDVPLNPTTGLELPAVRGERDRVAPPEEAAALIAAAPERDRALWATAFYTGLRLGELRALEWGDIDWKASILRVERSWDPYEGVVETKTRRGRRTVPIATALRGYLLEHHMLHGRPASGFVFGRGHSRPFSTSGVYDRARTAWKRMNAKRGEAELAAIEPLTLHEARHTYASLMIAAGVNAKALSTYMGHSSITITFDRYGHLMPGNEDAAAGLLDAFLDAAGAQTGAQRP